MAMVGKFGNCCCYKYGNNGIELFICIRAQMQRSCSGDRQPPRGGGADLGKEIMKAEHYPTMGRVMEIMREGLRINIANENRASGIRSPLLPAHEVEISAKLMLCATCAVAACSRRT